MTYKFTINEALKIKKKKTKSKVFTMRGDAVEIVQIDDEGDFPVLCLIVAANGSQRVQRYTTSGMKRPALRSLDDLIIYNPEKIDKDVVPYKKEYEKENLLLIDDNRNEVKIVMKNIFRDDLVNGPSINNMIVLIKTELGDVPSICDYNGMRDGNQILFVKKLTEYEKFKLFETEET